MKFFDELKWRGLVNDVSSPEVEDMINKGGVTFYIGTDPTGDSLHIGHFSSFLIGIITTCLGAILGGKTSP